MKWSRLRGWRLLLFAKCEQVSHIESDEWDGPVERDRWWAARLHRVSCGPCRHEARRLRWLRRMLATAPPSTKRRFAGASSATLSPQSRERLRARFAESRATEQE